MGLSMLFLRQENVRGISVLTWKLLYFPLSCGSGGNSLLRYLQALPLFSKFKLLLLLLLQGQLNKWWWAREGETGQHPASAPAAGGEPCSKQMLGDSHSSQNPTPLSSRGISSYSFAHWIKQEGSSQEYGHFITCIWRSDREKNPVCADVYMCLYIYNVLFKMTSFLRLKQTKKKSKERISLKMWPVITNSGEHTLAVAPRPYCWDTEQAAEWMCTAYGVMPGHPHKGNACRGQRKLIVTVSINEPEIVGYR